jgi:hypothetical protein
MSAAAVTLGNMRFLRGDADSASCVAVLADSARYARVVALQVARVMEAVPAHANYGIVVQLEPRDFQQTATHFLRVATPVQWPVESDID